MNYVGRHLQQKKSSKYELCWQAPSAEVEGAVHSCLARWQNKTSKFTFSKDMMRLHPLKPNLLPTSPKCPNRTLQMKSKPAFCVWGGAFFWVSFANFMRIRSGSIGRRKGRRKVRRKVKRKGRGKKRKKGGIKERDPSGGGVDWEWGAPISICQRRGFSDRYIIKNNKSEIQISMSCLFCVSQTAEGEGGFEQSSKFDCFFRLP